MQTLESYLPTIAVVLWTLGVIAFLIYFFRRWWRGLLLWTLVLLAMIAIAMVQLPIEDLPGYKTFIASAAWIGRAFLVVGLTGLIVAIAALIVYAIRYGKQEGEENSGADVEHGRIPSMQPLTIHARVKTLNRKSGYVTMQSLVDGTATKSDRMMAIAIVTMFVSLRSFPVCGTTSNFCAPPGTTIERRGRHVLACASSS